MFILTRLLELLVELILLDQLERNLYFMTLWEMTKSSKYKLQKLIGKVQDLREFTTQLKEETLLELREIQEEIRQENSQFDLDRLHYFHTAYIYFQLLLLQLQLLTKTLDTDKDIWT